MPREFLHQCWQCLLIEVGRCAPKRRIRRNQRYACDLAANHAELDLEMGKSVEHDTR